MVSTDATAGHVPGHELKALAKLIRRDRDQLLTRWRALVRELASAKHLDVPTLNDHLPTLLDELAEALESKSDETIAEALRDGSPLAHGLQRVQDGFDIVEVVAEYNILRGCVHDLAEANGFSLQGQAFHILNRVLDSAIGYAVESFATERALEVQHRREEYLAFVAHDLRTPLNAMSLVARVLDKTVAAEGGSAENARMIKSLQRNVRHLEVLVAKVLEENTNLQTEIGIKLERRSFDLWPLVEALVHDIHPVAGSGSTQLINMVPEDLVVCADASLLRRIFQNLIANAIVYTPRGEVRIGAEPGAAEDAVLCWVSDNGAGIPAELLDKVFEKGAGDPEKDGSTGLGLAIVKTFIEAHGGTAHAESELGRGTTVRFTLPSKVTASSTR
ncbi:MAG: sensor histidine kinase [Acidobacteriota bacterium]|nr:sensor histidine kinase [Acidobacteriota bacterium]